MKKYDTNFFVNYFKSDPKPEIEQFYFSDLNLCEWLKGKNRECAKVEFFKIDRLIKETNSSYRFRNDFERYEVLLNSGKDDNYRFHIAEKIAKRIFLELTYHFSSLVFLIILIVASKKLDVPINEGKIKTDLANSNELYNLSYILSNVKRAAEKNALRRDARQLFFCKKDDVDKWCVNIYNSLIQTLNKERGYGLFVVNNKHLNTDNVVYKNGIKVSYNYIVDVIDSSIDVKQNKQKNVFFYAGILKPLLVDGKSFEFNDICDNYYEIASMEMEVTFYTSDVKHKQKKQM